MPARARRVSCTAGTLSVKYARICPSVRRTLGSRPQFSGQLGSCASPGEASGPGGRRAPGARCGGVRGQGRAAARVRAPRPGPSASRRSGPRPGRPGWRPARRRSRPGPAGTPPRPTWARWAAARPARPPARAGGPAGRRPRRSPANACRSSGVFRLATNGAMPNASRGATRGELQREAAQLLDVGHRLARQTDHHVELQLVQAVRAAQLGRAQQVLLVASCAAISSRSRSEAPSEAVVSVR